MACSRGATSFYQKDTRVPVPLHPCQHIIFFCFCNDHCSVFKVTILPFGIIFKHTYLCIEIKK